MFGHDLASGDISALFEQGKEGETEAGYWIQTVCSEIHLLLKRVDRRVAGL